MVYYCYTDIGAGCRTLEIWMFHFFLCGAWVRELRISKQGTIIWISQSSIVIYSRCLMVFHLYIYMLIYVPLVCTSVRSRFLSWNLSRFTKTEDVHVWKWNIPSNGHVIVEKITRFDVFWWSSMIHPLLQALDGDGGWTASDSVTKGYSYGHLLVITGYNWYG